MIFPNWLLFLVIGFTVGKTSPNIIKTSLHESTNREGKSRYPIFLSTPSELGDTAAGSRGHCDFWVPIIFFGTRSEIIKSDQNFEDPGAEIRKISKISSQNNENIEIRLATSNACNFATRRSYAVKFEPVSDLG